MEQQQFNLKQNLLILFVFYSTVRVCVKWIDISFEAVTCKYSWLFYVHLFVVVVVVFCCDVPVNKHLKEKHHICALCNHYSWKENFLVFRVLTDFLELQHTNLGMYKFFFSVYLFFWPFLFFLSFFFLSGVCASKSFSVV
jgi:hypothetical protein